MTHRNSMNKQSTGGQNKTGTELQAKILTILQMNGALPVEELVAHLPQFRWVEVLKAVSWLWGEEKLELEQSDGRIVVRLFGEWHYLGKSSGSLAKMVDENMEVQASLDILLKDEEGFAKRFYDRVFELAPVARGLFKGDMTRQGRLLTHMLSGIVYSLSRPNYLKMGLRALGKSHIKYGVLPDHYPIVKQALLETIEAELGDHYSEAIGSAWEQALTLVLTFMLEGTQQATVDH